MNISLGMSVVPNLEIWSEMPTNMTLAAKCSVSAVAHQAEAKPPYEPPVTPTLSSSTSPVETRYFDAVDQVVELTPGVVGLVELRVLDASAGRATVVRVEDRVALGGGELARRRIAGHPAVRVVRLGAAVDDDDQRMVATFLERPYQNPLHLETVAGAVGDRLLLRQVEIGEPRVAVR